MNDDPFTRREAEALNEALRDLTLTLREVQREMAATYVRKDVLEPVLASMKRDDQTALKFISWIGYAVGGAVLVALLAVVVRAPGFLG